MNGLLVRVGIDSTDGEWNAPVLKTGKSAYDFAYVTICESKKPRAGLQSRFYDEFSPAVERLGQKIPDWLVGQPTHLDPDFENLTYGDCNQRAKQIEGKLGSGDLLVFYAGLRDVASRQLVYALIGLYVIDEIVKAASVPRSSWHKNAHTRRLLTDDASDIVVRARPGVSGRLRNCLPIGSYRVPSGKPNKRKSYRVEPSLLAKWGDLSVADGFLQRSVQLPEFQPDASRFYKWFLNQKPEIIAENNPIS